MAYNSDKEDEDLKTLSECIDDYVSYESATNDSRSLSEKCIDYFDNIQYTQEELKILNDRGQPAITENIMARQIKALIGYERQGRTTIKAYPRNPDDNHAADVATDVIRYVGDTNNIDVVFSKCWGDMLKAGTCASYVRARPGKGDAVDIVVDNIPFDRLWYDQNSRELDFSDAKYAGIVMWMDKDDALAMYPDAEDILSAAEVYDDLGVGYGGGTANRDRPIDGWVDSTMDRPRIKVVEEYYRKGHPDNPVWYYCVFVRTGFLVEPMKSPYLDDYMRPTCPVLLQSAYISRRNTRYGEAAFMLDLQDEVNKRRSKYLHMVNTRQLKISEGAVSDPIKLAQDVSRPDAVFMVRDGAEFEFITNGDLAQGHLQLYFDAKQELQATGGNASLSGTEPRTLSGVAEQARQRGAIVSIQSIFDELRNFKKRVHEAIWERCRQFMTAETWIRVTDDRSNARFAGLNRRMPLIQALQDPDDAKQVLNKLEPRIAQAVQAIMQSGVPIEQLPPQIQQLLFEPVVLDNIAQMDVDIIMSEIPDVVNSQMEQLGLLAEAVRAGVPIPPNIYLELWAEASSFPNKQRLLDMLQGKPQGTPQEQQAAAQQQQQQQAIQQQAVQLQIAQSQANVAKTQADAEKSQAEANYKKVQAATEMGGLIKDRELPPDFSLQ